jgi:hypothetical protein
MTSFFEDETAQMDVVPLILCKDDEYIVDESTLSWIESHTGGFAVVACAGKYRTGKSFLLNRLTQAHSGTGFGVGETVQACTKGLWVYKHFVKTSDPDKDLLFVDTEGIDALDADDTHDVRIFTLALLLSSVFIYNSIGTIDETAMQTLSLMTRVTNNVRIQSDSECSASELSEHMPDFYWVLRDFALRLTDRNDEAISTKEYLEQSLTTSDPQRDHIRSAIREAFPTRDLVTLPRPDTNANNLESRLYNVSSKFTSAVDRFRDRLMRDSKPVTSQKKIVSGRMYGTLCRHLVQMIQTNAVPVIRDSWSLMAAVQARDLKDELISDFEREVEALDKASAHIIDDKLAAIQKRVLAAFDARAMVPIDQEIRGALEQRLVALAEQARMRLARDLSEDACRFLDEIEADVLGGGNASEMVATQERAFKSEFGIDPMVKAAWTGGVSDRVLKWLSRLSNSFRAQHEEIELRLKTEIDRCASLQRELKDVRESNAQEFKIRVCELEQQLESRIDEISSLHASVSRQSEELIALEHKYRIQEVELSHVRLTEPNDDSTDQVLLPVDAERLEHLQLELVRTQNELHGEKHVHEVCQKHASELEQKLQSVSATYAKLETNWKSGLDELRSNEHKIRSDAEQRIKQHIETQERIQMQLDESRASNSAMEERIRALSASAESNAEVHENEKEQLRDIAQRNRDQCEVAQQRVLEIHKNMLADLRERDERSREQQSTHFRERSDMQLQLTELTHENEKTKELLMQSKRRYSEFETMERECKRMKSQHQTDAMIINRLETEVDQMKRMTNTMSDERERLRQENLQMEGELAVLRAEKQLNDARNSLR